MRTLQKLVHKTKGANQSVPQLEGKIGNLETDEDIAINLGSQRLGKDVIQFKDANLKFDHHQPP